VEELIDVLKKNKVIEDLYPSNKWNTLSAEYSATVGKLTLLKAYIVATERIIDQVVYKLYGLTLEEIEVVDGSTK
jgi:hypothetical protein